MLILLLGIKCDLSDVRKVFPKEIQKFVKAKNLIDCYETSAKSGMIVKDSVKFLVQYIFNHNKEIAQLHSIY